MTRKIEMKLKKALTKFTILAGITGMITACGPTPEDSIRRFEQTEAALAQQGCTFQGGNYGQTSAYGSNPYGGYSGYGGYGGYGGYPSNYGGYGYGSGYATAGAAVLNCAPAIDARQAEDQRDAIEQFIQACNEVLDHDPYSESADSSSASLTYRYSEVQAKLLGAQQALSYVGSTGANSAYGNPYYGNQYGGSNPYGGYPYNPYNPYGGYPYYQENGAEN